MRTALGWALLLLAALPGCANLGAVREFSATSAQLTGYRDVTQRYVGSAERQLANLPTAKAYDSPRQNLVQLQADSQRQKASLLKLHDVGTGYMAALAKLAGEDSYRIDADIDAVSGAIEAAPQLGIDAEDAAAYARIASTVSSWILAAKQARDVRRMLKAHGQDMDRLLAAMQRASVSYQGVLTQEQQTAAAIQQARLAVWQQPKPGESAAESMRRDAVLATLRQTYAPVADSQAQAVQAAAAAAKGLAQVRDGHRAMLGEADRLQSKQLQALLKQAVADMKTVRGQLDSL